MVRLNSITGAMLFACCAMAAGACVTEEPAADVSSKQQGIVSQASALARNANGAVVATVVFTAAGGGTVVTAVARLTDAAGVHGFHVHANDNAANGDGCIADPAQPATTHFVSADGHFNPGGGIHGNHAGDMPPLFVAGSGTTATTFLTDRFTVDQIKGRAVIIHAGADNFGNIPVGTLANQYTANAADATTLTNNTGNAGNRIACGVIR